MTTESVPPPPDPAGLVSVGRETGGVTDPGSTDRSPSGAGTEPGRASWGGFDLPFGSPREALEWWYRPLAEARTWATLAGLFVGVLSGVVFFALAIVLVAVVGSLAIVAIGLLLVPPAFAAINALTVAERGRVGWFADPIEPRRLATGSGGPWSAISTRLTDPGRWLQVAHLLLGVVAGPVAFVVGIVGFGLVIDLFGAETSIGIDVGDSTDVNVGGGFSFGSFLLGVLLVPLAARWVQLVGRGVREYTAFFLGATREAELEERVEELSTQREQILDAVAGERRRIERNLHDGVQQQLVALGIDIGRAEAKMADDPEGAKELLGDAKTKVRSSIGELRLIGRGLHPAVLGDRGLDAALSAVVADAPIPISVDVSTDRDLPDHVAETAYYIVNESVANMLKYSKARAASVRVSDEDGLLPAVRIEVHDDGKGGADDRRGSGIAGMRARVEGVDGAFALSSPEGGPTVVTAVIPVRRSRVVDGSPGGPSDGSGGES